MRIVTKAFLEQAARDYPKAGNYLAAWRKHAQTAAWQNLADVRRLYPATDSVRVASGSQVLVFNVCGDDYRLIVAAHFRGQRLYLLRFLTHAEYSKNHWKDHL